VLYLRSLDRSQVRQDCSDIARGKNKLRHVRMAGEESFPQGLGKRFDWIALRQCPKWWRFAVRASARTADCVAHRAMIGQQAFASALIPAPVLSKSRRCGKQYRRDHDRSKQYTICALHRICSVQCGDIGCVRAWWIPSRRALPRSGFSIIGMPALAARLFNAEFGFVVMRMAGTETFRSRSSVMRSIPLIPGSLSSMIRQWQAGNIVSLNNSSPRAYVRTRNPSTSRENFSDLHTAASSSTTTIRSGWTVKLLCFFISRHVSRRPSGHLQWLLGANKLQFALI